MDKPLPDYINLLKEAEEYDSAKNYGMHDNSVDAIEVDAKLMCDGGRIGSQQWDKLTYEYR